MSTSRNGPAIAPRAAGFSMVELLIALSITAILMVATVVAFDAALYNYRANQDIASVSITWLALRSARSGWPITTPRRTLSI